MQFTGAFQRSGRESEGNVAENYQAYARADVGFFRQAARYSSLFDDQLQIDDFANALTAACDYLAEPHVMGDIMAAAICWIYKELVCMVKKIVLLLLNYLILIHN